MKIILGKHRQNVHLIDCKRLSGAGNLYGDFHRACWCGVSGALTHSWTDPSWPGEQPQNAVDTGSVLQQIRGRSHDAGKKSPGALGQPDCRIRSPRLPWGAGWLCSTRAISRLLLSRTSRRQLKEALLESTTTSLGTVSTLLTRLPTQAHRPQTEPLTKAQQGHKSV